MKHTQSNTRRRAARLAASSPAFASLDSAVRKGAIRSHHRSQFALDMEDVELARIMLASGVGARGAFVSPDRADSLRSVANIQRLTVLQEIFPDVAVEVMEDVLIASQFRMDAAASMLSEISRELGNNGNESPQGGDFALEDWTSVQSESVESDEWHDVAASRPEIQQWVLVQDDWEVVDGDATAPEKARSFADVLRASASSASTSAPLPQLTRVKLTSTLSQPGWQKKAGVEGNFDDADEMTTKTFNARKRRSLRKFRG